MVSFWICRGLVKAYSQATFLISMPWADLTSTHQEWFKKQFKPTGIKQSKILQKYINRFRNVQNPSDIPSYWLVDRDLYNGLLQSLYNWVVQQPTVILITAHLPMIDMTTRQSTWMEKAKNTAEHSLHRTFSVSVSCPLSRKQVSNNIGTWDRPLCSWRPVDSECGNKNEHIWTSWCLPFRNISESKYTMLKLHWQCFDIPDKDKIFAIWRKSLTHAMLCIHLHPISWYFCWHSARKSLLVSQRDQNDNFFHASGVISPSSSTSCSSLGPKKKSTKLLNITFSLLNCLEAFMKQVGDWHNHHSYHNTFPPTSSIPTNIKGTKQNECKHHVPATLAEPKKLAIAILPLPFCEGFVLVRHHLLWPKALHHNGIKIRFRQFQGFLDEDTGDDVPNGNGEDQDEDNEHRLRKLFLLFFGIFFSL